MISERALKELQATAKNASIDLGKKIWDYKWIILPTAIFSYGLIKHRGALKPVTTTPKAKQSKEDPKAAKKEVTLSSLEKKQNKNRNYASSINIHAKLGANSYKEEGMQIEDLSTSCQSDKDNMKLKVPVIMRTDAGINSGYHSDVESNLQDDDRKQERRAHNRNSSCADDLFFNIFQQLK